MLINIPKGQAARLVGQKGCEEKTGMGEEERELVCLGVQGGDGKNPEGGGKRKRIE